MSSNGHCALNSKMRWGFLLQLKTFMSFKMTQDKGWQEQTNSASASVLAGIDEAHANGIDAQCNAAQNGGGDDELDLDLTVNNSKGWTKRWSLGSDSNGEYAKVQNGIEADFEQMKSKNELMYENSYGYTRLGGYEIKSPANNKKLSHVSVEINQKPKMANCAKNQNGHCDVDVHLVTNNDNVIPTTSLWVNNVNSKETKTNKEKEEEGFVVNVKVKENPPDQDQDQENGHRPCPSIENCWETTTTTTNGLILQDKWRVLFDKFDPEGFGEIPWTPDFINALKSKEFRAAIEPGKLLLLEDMAMVDSTHSTAITFQHFVNILSGKRSRSFKCAVHHRDREVCSESDFHIISSEPRSRVKRMARLIADEFLTDERDRKYYADHYRCLPPPLFIISVTLIELGFFTYYTLWQGEVSSLGPLPIDSAFVYRPDKREEIWRFLFYMVLHAGWVHLMFNLLVQLLVGLPLEMVHGSARIGCIYMAGVLAGSLGTSVFDPDVYLVGASGGVYALLAAHLANVLLNYNNMEFGLVRLLGVFLIASVDVGFAIYDRYAAPPPLTEGSIPPVSYVAHLTGALAGLTIGLLVLKNFEQRLREHLMWWLALGVYGACTIFAILFNVFHPTYP